MKTIHLEDSVIEIYIGAVVNLLPELLKRQEAGEGMFLSEGDIRALGVRYFDEVPEIINGDWETSTLLVRRGQEIKVILPYERKSGALTYAGKYGLDLICNNRDLVAGGVGVDVFGRWEGLSGHGVYPFRVEDLRLGCDLTEEEAMRHALLLTKLGHPDYVDSEFARPDGEVEAIIRGTFKIGKKEHHYDKMMKQELCLPDKEDVGVLKVCSVSMLRGSSESSAGFSLDAASGRMAFQRNY